MANWWEPKQLFQDVLGGAAGAGIVEGIKGTIKEWSQKKGQKAAEGIIKAIEAERVKLFISGIELEAHDRVAAQNLMRRWQLRQLRESRTYGIHEPYVYGDENRMTKILTTLFVAMDDNPQDRQQRIETFVRLGRMSDQQFDTSLEILHDDTVMQWLRRADQEASEAVRNVRVFLESRGVRNTRISRGWLVTYIIGMSALLITLIMIISQKG